MYSHLAYYAAMYILNHVSLLVRNICTPYYFVLTNSMRGLKMCMILVFPIENTNAVGMVHNKSMHGNFPMGTDRSDLYYYLAQKSPALILYINIDQYNIS